MFFFWEDVDPNRRSKVFFYEQLKILTKFIKEANPKIRTNREVFKREIEEWNALYDKQFISKTTDITLCSRPKEAEQKLLKQKARCNKWGNWIRTTNCPTCGDGLRKERRDCYNYNRSVKLSESKCQLNGQKSTREIACYNRCRKEWGGWDRTNCFGHGAKCHREWFRDCYYTLNGKRIEPIGGCRGSHRREDKWNDSCGGWGCSLKMSDKPWNLWG